MQPTRAATAARRPPRGKAMDQLERLLLPLQVGRHRPSTSSTRSPPMLCCTAALLAARVNGHVQLPRGLHPGEVGLLHSWQEPRRGRVRPEGVHQALPQGRQDLELEVRQRQGFPRPLGVRHRERRRARAHDQPLVLGPQRVQHQRRGEATLRSGGELGTPHPGRGRRTSTASSPTTWPRARKTRPISARLCQPGRNPADLSWTCVMFSNISVSILNCDVNSKVSYKAADGYHLG